MVGTVIASARDAAVPVIAKNGEASGYNGANDASMSFVADVTATGRTGTKASKKPMRKF